LPTLNAEQALRSLLVDGAAPRLTWMLKRGHSGSSWVTGSEDGITNAQTKVLEAADKVTSIEKTLPLNKFGKPNKLIKLLVISCEFVI